MWLTKSTEERSSDCVSSCTKIAHIYPQKYVFPSSRKKVIALYFQFTFVKVHLSGRSMPRVLVNGEVVRAEVLPRQWAHQDPPQGREGAAGNLSIHFAGSHIIGALMPLTSTHMLVIQMETTSNPRPAWCLRRYSNDTIRSETWLSGERHESRFDEVRSDQFYPAVTESNNLKVIIRFRPINVALRFNEIIWMRTIDCKGKNHVLRRNCRRKNISPK